MELHKVSCICTHPISLSLFLFLLLLFVFPCVSSSFQLAGRGAIFTIGDLEHNMYTEKYPFRTFELGVNSTGTKCITGLWPLKAWQIGKQTRSVYFGERNWSRLQFASFQRSWHLRHSHAPALSKATSSFLCIRIYVLPALASNC